MHGPFEIRCCWVKGKPCIATCPPPPPRYALVRRSPPGSLSTLVVVSLLVGGPRSTVVRAVLGYVGREMPGCTGQLVRGCGKFSTARGTALFCACLLKIISSLLVTAACRLDGLSFRKQVVCSATQAHSGRVLSLLSNKTSTTYFDDHR